MPADGSSLDRIYIIGGIGTGKTTLARRIAATSGLPLHNLDEIARVGGGTGPERSPSERSAAVDAIARSPAWVVEGVHLGWTEPLLDEADVIVWLDHVRWQVASRRMIRRFISQALAEAGRQKGRRKVTRFGDYIRRLRELAAAIPESRTYERAGRERDGDLSRAQTLERLRGFGDKVVHCRTPQEVEAFLDRVKSRAR